MRARMKFPKASAWHSPKGPFREALELRALPPRFRFVRLIQWVEEESLCGLRLGRFVGRKGLVVLCLLPQLLMELLEFADTPISFG